MGKATSGFSVTTVPRVRPGLNSNIHASQFRVMRPTVVSSGELRGSFITKCNIHVAPSPYNFHGYGSSEACFVRAQSSSNESCARGIMTRKTRYPRGHGPFRALSRLTGFSRTPPSSRAPAGFAHDCGYPGSTGFVGSGAVACVSADTTSSWIERPANSFWDLRFVGGSFGSPGAIGTPEVLPPVSRILVRRIDEKRRERFEPPLRRLPSGVSHRPLPFERTIKISVRAVMRVHPGLGWMILAPPSADWRTRV